MSKRIKSTGNDITVRVGYGEVEKDLFKSIIGVALERLPENYTVKDVYIDSDKRYVEVVGTPLRSLF